MSESKPALSIGLPVYNGEAFLAESIDSLLAQSYTDFELIIADNASTDSTAEICRSRAASDSRVRYVRNDENIGAMRNFNLVVEMSRAPYFKWAAHDDVHDPEYVLRCMQALEADPAVSLAYPRVQDIDEAGNPLTQRNHSLRTSSPSVSTRFSDLIRNDYTCEAIFGIMPTERLKRTPLLANYADCDRVLLTEIGLSGPFVEIEEYLFIHRQHQNRSVRQFKSRQTRAAWFDPSRAGKPAFPYHRELRGYLAAIRRAQISSGDKFKCRALMVRWVAVNAGGLFEDILFALRHVLRPLKHAVLPSPNGEVGDK